MRRLSQVLLIASFLPFCWLAFMTVHELGHVVIGEITGGAITKLVLHPFGLSRTDVSPNPYPLAVVWGGPAIGVLLPLVIWGFMRRLGLPYDYLARFFAGFCLIANGTYIAAGAVYQIGDAGDMLRHGAATWHLLLFGLIAVPMGLLTWHRLGPAFGLGESNGRVDRGAVYWSLGLFAVLFGAMLGLSPRY